MQRSCVLMAVVFAVVIALPHPAGAWNRGEVETFAVLPPGSSGPEGLEVDSSGNVYVTTFGFTSAGEAPGPGQLFVFNVEGELLRQVGIAGSTSHLLGLRFHPMSRALLVIDFGGSKVLEVNSQTGASQVFVTLPPLPHPELGAGLNDITFDRAGNVYVSDSFQGIVWKTGQHGGVATVWVDNDLLRTRGVPPFGANGLRFNNEQTALFVANTGNNTIVKASHCQARRLRRGDPERDADSPALSGEHPLQRRGSAGHQSVARPAPLQPDVCHRRLPVVLAGIALHGRQGSGPDTFDVRIGESVRWDELIRLASQLAVSSEPQRTRTQS